jgi:L-fuconolactonase
MITDAQVHLWPENGPQYPWPEGTAPDLPEAMTAERFIPMMDALGIDRAIIAPPAVSGFDPGYAIACAEKYPARLAVTSRWDFADPAGIEKLPSWLDKPGMVGIRIALMPSTIGALEASGKLAEFFAVAEQSDIPLMAFAPGTIAALESAANQYSRLKLVVDHANLVGSTPETVAEKIAELLQLARYDNVAVKLGALPQRSAQTSPYRDLHPHLLELHRAFGASRLMWASDLTTSLKTGTASYSENLGMIREAYSSLPGSDLDWILGRTVSEWFNWRG